MNRRTGILSSNGSVELEAIREADYSSTDLRAARAFLGRIEYTTTALLALAHALEEAGDERGADMIRICAEEFAKHEAEFLS